MNAFIKLVEERGMSAAGAARMKGVYTNKILRAIESGELSGVLVDKIMVVDRYQVEKWTPSPSKTGPKPGFKHTLETRNKMRLAKLKTTISTKL